LNGLNYYRIFSRNREGVGETTKIQSIQFDDNKPRIIVYPNPTTDVVFVQNLPTDVRSLTLTNTAGQTVLTNASAKDYALLNVAHLPNGVYFLTVYMEKGGYVQKIEKQ
jgi:Secretion system C-terminal sorting domain